MLIKVNELKRELKSKKDEMRSLINKGLESEEKRMTEEQGKKYCDAELKVKELEGQIELAERNNALEMEQAAEQPNDDIPSDSKDEFRSGGEFLNAVMGATRGNFDNRLIHETRAASGQNITVPSEGGFLVPENLQAGIMKKIFEKSPVASRCQKITIGSNANSLSWKEIQQDSRAAGSRHGGVRGYWTSEADTVTASKMKFSKRQLDLDKLMALSYATEESLQDATALESILSEEVSDELAFLLDEAIFSTGTGSGMPKSILNSDCLVTVAKETSQTATTIVAENIAKMRARLWARSRPNSVWFVNQDCEPQLHLMSLAVGTGGVPVYMPASGLSGAPYDTLYGRPVIPIEQAKTLGTVGDIVLADMSQYRLIEKQGIKKSVSMHVRFLYDEQAFRWTWRINGAPLWTSALTPNQGSNTLSPMVALATRA